MTRVFSRAVLTALLLFATSCGDDAPPAPPDEDAGGGGGDSGVIFCADGVCPSGLECSEGICIPIGSRDAGDGGSTLAGKISVDPTSLDFGAIAHRVPVQEGVTIRNIGQGDLHVLQASIDQNTNGEFQVVPAPLPATLAPGE